jgi:peptide deformylase
MAQPASRLRSSAKILNQFHRFCLQCLDIATKVKLASAECATRHMPGRCEMSTSVAGRINRTETTVFMALLNILRDPDPRLHTIAKPVAQVDARIRRLVDDMLQTMYAADGVGLAATQVDVHERVIVIDTSEQHNDPCVLINPELVETSEEMTLGDEGCLSVPMIFDKVARHARVTVRALDRAGEVIQFEAEGLLAICVQHEMDHLMGKVFVEYLSPLKRERIKSKMLKKTREEQRA